MEVEIVSIGNKLLMSDILDTSTPYISRSLREAGVQLTCKVTVGDDLDLIVDVLKVAMGRADVVLTVGAPDGGISANNRLAAAKVMGRRIAPDSPAISGSVSLGRDRRHMSGFLVEEGERVLICLPGKRREMSYLLETEVLPYLHRRLSREERSGWILLRTVDIMESSLKQQLEDLPLSPTQQISYESFAGQTDIRLWVEAESSERVDVELKGLRKEVAARLGDHIYGEGEDRLEQVVYQALVKSGNSLALAECATGGSLTEAFADPHSSTAIAGLQFDRFEDMGQYLELERSPAGTDLAGWCQSAATKLLAKMGANLALVTGKNKSQGGVQVVVSLASSNGVSVTQRSFGGHPENIDQWCYTLALSHLRRWLLAHH